MKVAPAVLGLFLAVEAALLLPAAPAAAQSPSAEPAGAAEDFMVVDCLLPGRVRRLGRQATYVTRRQPVRTTALDCRIRGGEFTAFDRASYATALAVWLEEARGGAAEAQYYVGQIFEKGLGRDPDFAAAADWYRRASAQGHSGATTSLAFLYETGLGVERNPELALNLYRQASGLPGELVVLEGSEHEELLARLEQRSHEVEELEQRARRLQEELEEARRAGGSAAETAHRLEEERARLQQALEQSRQQVTELEARLAGASSEEGEAPPSSSSLVAGVDLGAYHALVIGNRRYAHLPELAAAEAEARALAAVLETRYGFQVRLLLDASRSQMMRALNTLREELTEKDNLILFYAGHSSEDRQAHRGWWLPVDADPESRAQWIPDRVLSDHLEVLPARQVLVLADAVFATTMTRSSIPRLPRGMSPERRREHLREMASRRTRLVLASGESKAPPESPGGHFSTALVAHLEANEQVLEASTLYRLLARELGETGGRLAFAPIRWSGHQGGADFLFVPLTMRVARLVGVLCGGVERCSVNEEPEETVVG